MTCVRAPAITPKGEWGKGKIELVEIPTNDETNDNIVTYWTPDQLPEPGKEMNFKYTITFSRDEDKLHAPDNAYVMQTRRSTGDVKQSNLIRQPDGTIAFIVDFTGADMKKLPADTRSPPRRVPAITLKSLKIPCVTIR